MADNNKKLSVLALGFSLGVTWGLGMLVAGLFATYFNWGTDFVNTMGSIYLGFQPTFVGSLIGMVWGLVDAFVGGVVIAWLYNLCSCCPHCSK